MKLCGTRGDEYYIKDNRSPADTATRLPCAELLVLSFVWNVSKLYDDILKMPLRSKFWSNYNSKMHKTSCHLIGTTTSCIVTVLYFILLLADARSFVRCFHEGLIFETSCLRLCIKFHLNSSSNRDKQTDR